MKYNWFSFVFRCLYMHCHLSGTLETSGRCSLPGSRHPHLLSMVECTGTIQASPILLSSQEQHVSALCPAHHLCHHSHIDT